MRLACLAPLLCAFVAVATRPHVIEVFTRAGCPRCETAVRFLEQLRAESPDVHIDYRHVDTDPEALARLRRLSHEAGVVTPGVPSFLLGGRLVVGYLDDGTTGAQLRRLLEGGGTETAPAEVCPPGAQEPCATAALAEDGVQTRLFGTIALGDLGLPLFTVVVGLLDGFNPCAMWVLLFLLSLLVNLHDRRRMALIATTFVLVSGAMYFAFMAAWLNVFLLVGLSRAAEVTLGVVALIVGAINVKDAVAFKRGPSLTIPESAKPGIYVRARQVLRAERLGGALVGVAALAVFVNLIELLCTAGLPAVYTAILSRQQLPAAAHYAYLGLYNLAYVADDSLMVALAVVTLGRRKLQEREGRWLKLVSGVVMLGLATALLLFPRLLA